MIPSAAPPSHADIATVIRGVALRGQAVSMGGRPRPEAKLVVHAGARDEASPKEEQSAPVRASADASQVPSQTDIERLRLAARQSGFEEGRQQGYQDGQHAGQQEGFAAGKRDALAQASALIAEAREQATKEAIQRATTQAEQEIAQRWKQYQDRLDTLLAALPNQIAQRLDASEDDMLALCMDALVQLLGRQAVQPQALRPALEHAMQQLKARPLISVALHPSDLAALQVYPGWSQWCAQNAANVRWVENATLELGGCIVVSPEGSLDARLDTQLHALRELLLASRREAAAHGHGAST